MAKGIQRASKNVRVPERAVTLLTRIRATLQQKTGLKVTESGTVERALNCLHDAHNRLAWLSPKEAGPVLTERHQDGVALALSQFAVQLGREVDRIEFSERVCRVQSGAD